MLYVSLSAAVIILIISGIFAFKNRHNSTKFSSILVAGLFLSTVFMVLPTDWVGDKTVSYPPFFAFVSSVFYAFEALGGAKEIEQLETINLSGSFKGVYIAVNYVISFLAPFITSGLILSLFGDVGEKIRYLFKGFGTCHVFSSLNQNTLALASGLKKSEGAHTFIFCNTKDCDEALVESARKMGGITFYKSISMVKPSIKHKKYNYYLLAENEDVNINDTISLLQVEKIRESDKVTINSFAHSDTNITLVESLDRGRAQLRFINEIALFVSNLMYEHPLHNLPDGCRDISVAVIGLGDVGLQTIKTAVWCGQIEGYTLRIRAFDKNAETKQSQFYSLCPELENYDIKFINADIQNADFESVIAGTEKEDGAEISYVVIATEDDNVNIITADNLRRIFIKLRPQYTNLPQIHTRVRSGVKSSNLLSDADYLNSRNIALFGSIDSVYSKNTLFNTDLEKLAFAVHLCYSGKLDCPKGSKEYNKALDEFLKSEYNRRSSMASALHIGYKLKAVSLIKGDGDFKEFIESDRELLNKLAINEHNRWVAFMRSEGWRAASLEDMEKFYAATLSYRDNISKAHPCITPWENLDDVEAKYHSLFKKPMAFKEYDYMITEKIPEIIKKAGEI